MILVTNDDGVDSPGLSALARALKSVDEVWSTGDGYLTRVLSLVVLGDFTSVYLACLAGVDPTPIDVITAVKRRLQEAHEARGTPNT